MYGDQFVMLSFLIKCIHIHSMKRSRLLCNDSTISVFEFHYFLNKAFDAKIPKGILIVSLTLRTSY